MPIDLEQEQLLFVEAWAMSFDQHTDGHPDLAVLQLLAQMDLTESERVLELQQLDTGNSARPRQRHLVVECELVEPINHYRYP